MTIDDVFARYARSKGLPPLNLATLPSDSSSARHIRATLERGLSSFDRFTSQLNDLYQKIGFQGINLHVGYVVDDRVFAQSAVYDGNDIILVSTGLVLLVRNVFIRFQIDGTFKAMFSGNGYPQIDTSPLAARVDSMAELDGISETSSAEVEEHLQIVDASIETALLFILHHELAHIWNGHFGWLHSRGEIAEFHDGIDSDASPIVDIYQHALERDADGRAIHAIMMQVLNLDFFNSLPALGFPKGSTLDGWTVYLTVTVLSLITTFNLTHYAMSQDLTLSPSEKHPAVSTRKMWMLQSITSAFANMPHKPAIDVAELIRTAERASAFGLSNAFGLDRRFALERFCSQPIPATGLVEAFKEMRPLLNRAKRGKFLPGIVETEAEVHKVVRRMQVPVVIEALVKKAERKGPKK